MQTVMVGAGPVGLLCALARADRGDEVTVVERDGAERRSVFQYRHPHFFRPQVRQVLERLAPQAWQAVLAAGAVPAAVPGMPPELAADLSGIAVRRSVLEQAIRSVVDADPRIRVVHGTATAVVADARVTGVVVDEEVLPADLLLCSTGRTGELGDQWRSPAVGGPCGQSYVSRMYRFVDGVDAFPQHFPLGAMGNGYQTIVFPQDDATLSALIIRGAGDKELSGLRDNTVFERVAAAIPNLAPWTDRRRFVPISDVMVGGLLTNTYRGQVTDDAPSGLLFLGDAVATTNPSAGRGVTLGLLQAAELLRLLDEHPVDEARARFATWCDEHLRPWYDDHVLSDAWMERRLRGEQLDYDEPLPSDLICDAALQDPSLDEAVGAYRAMLAPPAVLRPFEERARQAYQAGWRLPVDGPSRAELAELVRG